MKPETEIILPDGWQKAFGKALFWLSISLGLLAVGWRISPRNSDGLPLVLSPRLAQIGKYQQTVQRWADVLQESQEKFAALLVEPTPASLFAQNEDANRAYGRVLEVLTAIDQTDVPASLEGLRDLAQAAANATLTAGGETATWLGEPGEAQYQTALQALSASQQALQRLNESPWLAQDDAK